MNRLLKPAAALLVAGLASACGTLAPPPATPRPDIAPALGNAAASVAAMPLPGWREFLADARLVRLVEQALANNRDLRVAVLNVERARALHGIQAAARMPTIAAAAAVSRSGGDGRATTASHSLGVGTTDYEIDLFGRVRSLDEAALQRYFAQDEARRSAELSLVAEVASAWLALAADGQLLQGARATLANRLEAQQLAERRHELGAIAGLDVVQARSAVEAARVDLARLEGQVAADRHALALLAGGPLPEGVEPGPWGEAVTAWPGVPQGLPSTVLLRRPDVRRAEHLLQAAQADIGAARAAFFPSIRLTGSAGVASPELSGLFKGGAFFWSVLPQLTLPIFTGGRLQAGLEVAQADRDIALAQYERAVQAGFREVADALARDGTLAQQRQAQQALADRAREAEALARARYDAGRDGYLPLLDAQRTRVAADQALVAAQLAEQGNRVTLYKALGGPWKESRP